MMHDNNSSNNQEPPKEVSHKTSYIIAAFFLAASGTSAFAVYNLVQYTRNAEAHHETMRFRHINKMNMVLKDLEIDASILSLYLEYAKQGKIKPSECNTAQQVFNVASIKGPSNESYVSSWTRSIYISGSDAASFASQYKTSYAAIIQRSGQLKNHCEHMFKPAHVSRPSIDDVKSEWWQKPEISINYTK